MPGSPVNPLPFRTIEISDPRFEAGGLRWMTVKSAALRGRADITFWIPDPAGAEPAGLVILLHGVYGSHWAWALKGGAHRTAQRLMASGEMPPVVLAMPSDGLWGDGSGYVPHAGGDFERWIVEEVPAAARHLAGEANLRKKFFLSGLSMGGFGALRLGAKYGDLCAGISAHSSITEFGQMGQFVEGDLAEYGARAQDASALGEILDHRATLPPLRFDCGTSDPLIEPNRALHQELARAGVAHVYEEFEGGHEWPYWETHLADSLRFFAGCPADHHHGKGLP